METLSGAIAEIATDKPREECGVVGVYTPDLGHHAAAVVLGLAALQHRGEDSCGVGLGSADPVVTRHAGLVRDIPDQVIYDLSLIESQTASGHVRYSTVETKSVAEAAAPNEEVAACGKWFSLCHNGTIIKQPQNNRKYETDSQLLIHNLAVAWAPDVPLSTAIRNTLAEVDGAFSLVISTQEELIGVRDKHGIRPLVIGVREDGGYVLASESPALTVMGATYLRSVEPGEMVIIDKDGLKSEFIFDDIEPRECVFESIYFSRPETRIHNTSVQMQRIRMGELLAEQSPVEADMVIGVLDSGLAAAIGYSHVSGIRMYPGLVRDRNYIGRSFIQPDDASRQQAISTKHSADGFIVEGMRLVLVDDSIVRGDTTKGVVAMLRNAGAIEVHARIHSPPIIGPCFYGIDTGDRRELLAHQMNHQEMLQYLDLDSLEYLTEENLVKALGGSACSKCLACFNGDYPTPMGRVLAATGQSSVTSVNPAIFS